MRRFHQPLLNEIPSTTSDSESSRGSKRVGVIFGKRLRVTTLTMIAMNFTQMMQIFFFVSWLPQIVADLEFTASAAAGVSLYQNALGIAGALLVGWLARRWSIVPLAVTMMAGTSVAILGFPYLPHSMLWLRGGFGMD